ncbi:MAG: diacylglycerol/lipid kinase family protein [Planctomycetota bacterium]
MKVLAIVNPVSGRRNLAGVLREVTKRLCAAGWEVTVRLTRAMGDADQVAADAAEDTRAILAVGGDGTVREVVDGLLHSRRKIPVAILPTGTENLAAREFETPTDPTGIVQTILGGRAVPCDVGVTNGRHFLVVTGAGFDAEVVHRLADCRGRHITHWNYFWPIWRTFWEHRFPRLTVSADGEEVFEGRGLVLVGVMPRYSVGLRICRRARRDDGRLDLCIYPCATRRRLVHHALQTVAGRHDWAGDVIYRKCRQIRIEGDPRVRLEVDGDPGGHLPAECRVLPSATTFLELPARG